MPRAEVGTTKHLSNQLKSKGLQRLRWYCQVCSRQMRDENGFKCHTSSESHIRQMLLVGESPQKFIESYSTQFKHDFLTLLRTSHGEKKIDANRFYQEYISDKNHVHMNSTKWVTLSEFVKHLGRDGAVRVVEEEAGEGTRGGLFISWVDNSPEALKRQEYVRKKERMERGDEVRERRAIEEMVERAKAQAKKDDAEAAPRELVREEGAEKVKLALAFGKKQEDETSNDSTATSTPTTEAALQAAPAPAKVSIKMAAPKKNVFASMGKRDKKDKKDKKDTVKKPAESLKRPMSEAERIMREEQDRMRTRTAPGFKRPRVM